MLDLCVQTAWLENERLLTGKVEEITQQLLETIAFLSHQFNLGLGSSVAMLRGRLWIGRLKILREQLHSQPNRRKRIADLVGQCAHESRKFCIRFRSRAARFVA